MGNEARITLTHQTMDRLCKDLPRLLLELVNYCGLTKKVHGKFHNIYKLLMKINKKNISMQQFLLLSEAVIQGFLHKAEANLGYFLGWLVYLSLTQPDDPVAQIPPTPKSHVFH
jgi:hypothetical protein